MAKYLCLGDLVVVRNEIGIATNNHSKSVGRQNIK
jgi:hypothetical protein